MPHPAPSAFGKLPNPPFRRRSIKTSSNATPTEYRSIEQSLIDIRKLLEELLGVSRER